MERTLCGQVRAVPDDQTVRVSLPRHVYVVLGVFGVLMLGSLATQVILIEDQRTTTDEQLAINARQSARAIPLIDETKPLIERVRDALPAAGRLGREVEQLTKDASPLVNDLRAARADENIRAAGTLAAVLLDADVGNATRAGERLAEELLSADIPRLAGELQSADIPRLASMLLTEVPRTRKTTEDLLRRSLAVQEEALAVIKETLAIARETERHAESVDNKTGGPVPASGG
jgi:hypothetical protein